LSSSFDSPLDSAIIPNFSLRDKENIIIIISSSNNCADYKTRGTLPK
jgi:hypothetical protein